MAKKETASTRMLKHRVVSLLGDIDFDLASRAAEELLELQLESSEPAYLLINSGGGDGEAAFGLHDFIAHICVMEVRAVVIGRCGSAATFVLLACPKRLALPHARFLIHSGVMSNIEHRMDRTSSEKLQQLRLEVDGAIAGVNKFYQTKLDATEADVTKYMDRGDQDNNNHMNAEEAKSIKLITEIIEGKLPFFFPPENESPQ